MSAVSAAIQWLVDRNNPLLVLLRIGALLAVWSRVLACRKDHPPWSYVGVLSYLAVGLSWATINGLLVTFGVLEPGRYYYVTALSAYMLYIAVIVFFLTDRRRVLARQDAVECQIRRAEDLVDKSNGG